MKPAPSIPFLLTTLRRQLGWSHFKEIIPQQEELKRDFYRKVKTEN